MARAARSPMWILVAVLMGLWLVADTRAKSDSGLSQLALSTSPLRIQFIPDPNNIVNLAEGTPYTVPDGKLLIITDWVTTDASTIHPCCTVTITPRIYVDGTAVWGGGYAFGSDVNGSSGGTGTSTLSGALRSGIKVDAGATVTLAANPSSNPAGFVSPIMFASGYLAKSSN